MSEILAPAGSFESLIAALNTGTDAIYLGEENFSARKNAENFSKEKLREAVELCHRSSVKVYVTLNTLIFNREIEDLKKTIKNCAECDVDAFIVQDQAVAFLTKKIVPQMPLHASTQMTINSLEGAIEAKKLGFTRVVLGRELSYNQIKNIVDNCDIETELFVHGALCVCVSGQCYMSSILGGRSGNRGLCAQPCRLNFTHDKRENILSLKDLSIIDRLKSLEDIGVTSFKIEGRMKRPEYVAATVTACKSILEGRSFDFTKLRDVFSRSGFTSGYFDNDFKNLSGVRTKDDVIAASKALPQLRQLYKNPYKRYLTDINISIKNNKPIEVNLKADGVSVCVIGNAPEKAINVELTSESVISRFSKLGGTIFDVGEITASVDSGLSVSASTLNELRRQGIDALSNKILNRNTNNYLINEIVNTSKENTKKYKEIEYRCEVSDISQLNQALSNDEYAYIYAPIEILDKNTPDKFRIVIIPPIFLADCEEEIKDKLLKLKESGYKYVLAHTLSHISIINSLGMTPFGGSRLNITNKFSLEEYNKLGIHDTLLSFELLLDEAKEICTETDVKCGIIGYGRLPLMITRRCPIKDGKPCGLKKNPLCDHIIKDRHDGIFPCICNLNSVEILNPDMLILSDKNIDKIDYILLRFTDETDTNEIFDMYINKKKPDGKLTRGLYYRGVQ